MRGERQVYSAYRCLDGNRAELHGPFDASGVVVEMSNT